MGTRSIRNGLCCLACLTFSLSVYSQHDLKDREQANDLEKKLSSATTDRLPILLQLAENEKLNDPKRRIEYARQALELARGTKDLDRQASALFLMGCAYRDINEVPDAVRCFTEAGEFYKRLRQLPQHFNCLKNIGWAYENTGDYSQALSFYEQALNLAKSHSYEEGVGVALSYIGIIHINRNQYDQALARMLEALQIQERLGDKQNAVNTLNYIGSVYDDLKDYSKAMDYFQRSLAVYRKEGRPINVAIALNNIANVHLNTHRPKEALKVLNEALEISRKADDKMCLGQTLGILTDAYGDLGQFEQALACTMETMRIWKSLGNKENYGRALGDIGAIHLKKNDFRKAKRYLKEAVSVLDGCDGISLLSVNYLNLSKAQAGLSEWRDALESYKEGTQLKDKFLNAEKQKSITEMEAKYESETRKRQIDLLQKNNEIQKLQLSRARLRLWVLICGSGLLLTTIFLLFRRYLHLLAFWRKKHHIGRYLLGDRIGSGGLGIVYKASDMTQKSGAVAIKIIREEFSNDPVLTRRLKHEAILIDQLNHPNIVKVYERGEHDQQIYIVMELLQGRSMAEIMREGPMEISAVISIGIQLTDTLSAIHAKGIVHRDLKPENVMLVEQEDGPKVKLLDFDIAVGTNLTRLTETGRIMGTLHYIPPEQITSQQVLPAGDIYSLGVLLYEALTGMKPFPAELATDIIRQILGTEPIPPRQLRAATPAELDQLLLAMLAKDPAQRPDEGTILGQLEKAGEHP